ncbi:helix-turn-helix domain-containing protein [Oceanirhabdus sp. W0125-5]|uniref:helix-turn-helix domain-containing protein n=1 Tax=Oceanirhabdus sp. W0125-5 TaxID=2999116 RepID=UPI0022F2CC95|nr:XRE family transcriptional regulator [Oceanirhabdus sp. W0125-5]WBW95179.1 XRE family transcriptional regulator [Oceanirhabdus sp. W0125-5]
MNKDIGNKIKVLRQSKGMTLKDLSEQVGLSIGFFSQLERGLTSVAIDCLSKIAEVLGVELAYFFSSPKSKKDMVIKSYEQEVSQIINSNIIYYNLSTRLESSNMLPKLVQVLPHEGREEIEEYRHEGEEFIYVLEGILTLYLDHQKHILYPGDSVHFDSMLEHNWVNNTSMTTKFLVVNTPNFLKTETKDDSTTDIK